MKSSKSKSKPIHDHEGRMGSPIEGNDGQRKSQVESIANDVMSDGDADSSQGPNLSSRIQPSGRDHHDGGKSERDPMFKGNHPSQASASPVMHQHTTHDHETGESTTHKVKHGEPCPDCDDDYIGGM